MFRRGEISWLLHPGQQKLLNWLDDHRRDLSVIVTSRQFGKTFFALVYCLIYCIRHPKHTVLFLAPHLKQLETIMLPKLNTVMQFLPDDLIPSKRGMVWTFANGSIFRLDGITSGHAVRLRGDAVHLCVMDECRDINGLTNMVDSHISPMFTTTSRSEWGGRLMMISTPPESPMHSFTDFYIRNAELRGDLYKATYLTNPLLSTKRLRYLIQTQHPGGEKNIIFRREYMADWEVTDPDRKIVREWDVKANDQFFETYEGPPNPVRSYIGIDYGFSDPCGILGGYLDYVQGCLIITHEYVARKMNTDEVGNKIIEIENKLKAQLPGMVEPIRVCDIDPSFQADMYTRFGMRTEPCFKLASINTMLNRLRVAFLQGKIKVHPNCPELRFQLAAGVFKSAAGSTDYLRTERGGHLDLLDALKYLNLNCRWNEVMRPATTDYLRPDQMRIGGFAPQQQTFKGGMISRPR